LKKLVEPLLGFARMVLFTAVLSRCCRTARFALQMQKCFRSGEPELAAKSMKIVNSWDEYSPLKHIIVGRPDGSCVNSHEPASKPKVPLDSDMKGKFGSRSPQSVEKARKQMDHLCELLKSHGITVDRPEPIQWNNEIVTPFFTTETEFGCMPPRDVLLTVGNEILEATMSFRSRWFEYRVYRDILLKYWLKDKEMRWEAAPKPRLTDSTYKLDYIDQHETMGEKFRLEKVGNKDFVTRDWVEPLFDAADVCRLGKDLFVQHGFTTNLAGIEWLRRHFPELRIHAIHFPDDQWPIHIDASLIPLKPGLCIVNPSRRIPDYQKKIFERNGWHMVDVAPPVHNEPPPLCYSSVWLSMNLLVIDEKYIMVEASERHQIKQIEGFGFEVIPVPFRDVYAFGGGLHCATADVYREGTCEDYFPSQ